MRVRPVPAVIGFGIVGLVLAVPAAADPPVFAGRETVSEATLAASRGGFVLPNGMDVSLGIDIVTLVNRAPVLRTALRSGDVSSISVFVGDGTAASDHTGQSSANDGTPLPGGGTVRIVEGAPTSPTAGPGEQLVTLIPNGAAVVTPSGTAQLLQSDTGTAVVLAGNALDLRHMVGALTGTLVANTADNRVIDTVATVNIDLHNSALPLGNMMLRVDGIALDAATRSVR